MPLLQRQTPEQIKTHARHNLRRAAVGMAACVGTLLGLSTAATFMAIEKSDQGQERLEEYLFHRDLPDRQEDTYRQVSVLEYTSSIGSRPDGNWHVRHEPESPPDTGIDWKIPLGAVGGGGAVSLIGLTVLGAANRRRQDEQAAHEVDMETTNDYALYDFEQRQQIDDQRINAGYDGLQAELNDHDAYLTTLEQNATAALINARSGNDVNVSHMNILSGLGRNPLEGLNYACPDTYYELLEQDQPAAPVANACQPILPATNLY